jgi:hypothetical protein
MLFYDYKSILYNNQMRIDMYPSQTAADVATALCKIVLPSHLRPGEVQSAEGQRCSHEQQVTLTRVQQWPYGCCRCSESEYHGLQVPF